MGEYAKRGSEDVKIGTCENLYYLRYEDRFNVRHIPGNVNPITDHGLRWRLPFPDEDGIKPGDYAGGGFRSVLLAGMLPPDGAEDFPGLIQLHHAQSGLLINVPCYHGVKLPDLGAAGARAFWNGYQHPVELCAVKNLRDGSVIPITRCVHCRDLFRATWPEVLPYVTDKKLQKRLAEAYFPEFLAEKAA